ncbi:MAG: tetratricopeptide repeat protein [Alphaproteobacteria bacterium]
MEDIESEDFVKGKENFGLGKYQEALICFNQALKEVEKYKNIPPIEIYASCKASIYYYIGKSHLYLKQYDEAAIAFYKKTEWTPECYDSFDSLGLAYQNIGHIVKAEECHIIALEINPNFSSALHNLGLLKFKQGKYSESSSLLFKAYSIDKENPYILHSLANLLDKIGQSKESLQYYEAGLKFVSKDNTELFNALKQDYSEALNQVGHELYQDNKFDEASKYYSKALYHNPKNIITLNQLGMCASEQGNPSKALEYFNQIIKISEGKDADAWLNRAYCLMKQNKLILAKGAINISLDLNPDDETAIETYQEIMTKRTITKWKDFVKNQKSDRNEILR